MTLFLNSEDVRQILTIEITLAALDRSYRGLATQETVCRPRIDIRIPTTDPDKTYQWGTMEGGSSDMGYFAIRMRTSVLSVNRAHRSASAVSLARGGSESDFRRSCHSASLAIPRSEGGHL